MRVAEVIGTVTLSRWHPLLRGYRWVIAVPCSLEALRRQACGDGEDVVVLDQLGSGEHTRIGFSEGVEAAAPFLPERKPVDAYCACILDQVMLRDR